MFQKILVLNRGEIAVRVMRACREMGIPTVALYHESDRNSLHVWMADECVQLGAPFEFTNQDAILHIARQVGADAIHPGYGFLAEREDFVRRCDSEGITFIGPPAEVLASVRHKLAALSCAQEAGVPVPEHSFEAFRPGDLAALRAEAGRLGYPLVVKSSRGGRGRGARLVWSPERLERALRRAHAEALIFYGERRVYLERAILPAHQVGVQVIGDGYGNLVHLGEREGSLLYGNQKVIEESPAPCLDKTERAHLLDTALKLARLFGYQNVGTVEFLANGNGEFYFTEIKPRLQVEHPLAEMRSGVDLVRAQIRIAAGEPLELEQGRLELSGWAMQCRLSASDPWRANLPSPGHVSQLRLPGGPDVRVDTYLSCECDVPEAYDPLIAKMIVRATDRPACIRRLRSALQEFQLVGTETNLPLVQRLLEQPGFQQGDYSTELLMSSIPDDPGYERRLRDLAVVAAVAHVLRRQAGRSATPERLQSGWHRNNRRLA
jgi:acetyl/propionyl-CoA carboxylase alpha subunit